MEQLRCSSCQCVVGFMIDCGPHGSVYCPECHEANEDMNLYEGEDDAEC